MSLALAAIAANRFGYGARPNDMRAIAGDPRGWVKAQLAPERAPPAPLSALPPAEDDILTYGRFITGRRLRGPEAEQAMRRLERAGIPRAALTAASTDEDSYRSVFLPRYIASVAARFSTAISSDRPVFERLVAFWSNHFTVSAVKPQVASLPQSFERDVVRPQACGRFADMLIASAKHPAMSVYLDNGVSIGPNSVWAKTPSRIPRYGLGGRRPTGLNENFARETLELHTLGVDGGYTQADVRALASILTGWMTARIPPTAYFSDAKGVRTGPQLFIFESEAHEPGPKTLLGKTYAEAGQAEGETALRDLARHPATATHIATKLVRHFVADQPPPACVARVAQAFRNSDGDIPTTMAALVDSPEAWETPPAKFKRPDEFFISALRAMDVRDPPPPGIVTALESLGQRTYFAPGPDGWSDRADGWLSADLVWKRLEWVQALAERVARADLDPVARAEAVLGPALTPATRTALQRAESPAQAVVLFLMSPEFQRR